MGLEPEDRGREVERRRRRDPPRACREGQAGTRPDHLRQRRWRRRPGDARRRQERVRPAQQPVQLGGRHHGAQPGDRDERARPRARPRAGLPARVDALCADGSRDQRRRVRDLAGGSPRLLQVPHPRHRAGAPLRRALRRSGPLPGRRLVPDRPAPGRAGGPELHRRGHRSGHPALATLSRCRQARAWSSGAGSHPPARPSRPGPTRSVPRRRPGSGRTRSPPRRARPASGSSR